MHICVSYSVNFKPRMGDPLDSTLHNFTKPRDSGVQQQGGAADDDAWGDNVFVLLFVARVPASKAPNT